MTEFHVDVVRLGPIRAHQNADRLEITNVHGGYPCIIKKDSMKEGDLAVYIPIDTVLPATEPFAFLSESDRKKLRAKKLRGIFSSPPQGWHFPHYTDVEPLRRHGDVLTSGEEVVVTEKIHGANGRFVHDGERLWVGSRTQIKAKNSGCTKKSIWWIAAENADLETKLARFPMKVFFGEV